MARRRISARAVRVAAWVTVSVPAVLLGVQAVQDGLGANPVEAITHATGIWALRFLVASLTVTPLRRLGLAALAPARRILGLGAFGWAFAHFTTYLTLDLGFDFGFLGEDVLERPYITVGFSALAILGVLAVTSTRGWQKKLGRRWTLLHRGVYPAAVLAALHFVWLVKADLREPAIYAALIAGLLAVRAGFALRSRTARSADRGAAVERSSSTA